MTKIKKKQLNATFGAYLRLQGFVADGWSNEITSDLASLLATAGDGGVSVPLQISNSGGLGLPVTPPANKVEIWAWNRQKILDQGNTQTEVFGRLTHSGGVYTLTYYSLDADGNEATFNFGSPSDIYLELVYRFDFARLPIDFAIAIPSRNVADDPSRAKAAQLYTQLLSPTGTNTLPDLEKTPNVAANLLLIVNGLSIDNLSGSPLTLSGKTITWSASVAGYNLETTDRVIARYTTLE